METSKLILLILAAVFFALSIFNEPARFNLIAAGLFTWVLTELITAVARI